MDAVTHWCQSASKSNNKRKKNILSTPLMCKVDFRIQQYIVYESACFFYVSIVLVCNCFVC